MWPGRAAQRDQPLDDLLRDAADDALAARMEGHPRADHRGGRRAAEKAVALDQQRARAGARRGQRRRTPGVAAPDDQHVARRLIAPRLRAIAPASTAGAPKADRACLPRSQAFYEAIYEARGKDYAAEAAWLRAAIGVANPGAKRVLDVACGTGAHLRFLHRHFEVAGEDADAAMIAIAKERLPGVPLRVGRMQDLAVDAPFDALMCLFGSIGYVADEAELRTTIARFAAAVGPGGLVIVEPWLHPEDWRDGTLEASFVDQPQLKIARIGTNERYGTTAVIRYEYLVGEADRRLGLQRNAPPATVRRTRSIAPRSRRPASNRATNAPTSSRAASTWRRNSNRPRR